MAMNITCASDWCNYILGELSTQELVCYGMVFLGRRQSPIDICPNRLPSEERRGFAGVNLPTPAMCTQDTVERAAAFNCSQQRRHAAAAILGPLADCGAQLPASAPSSVKAPSSQLPLPCLRNPLFGPSNAPYCFQALLLIAADAFARQLPCTFWFHSLSGQSLQHARRMNWGSCVWWLLLCRVPGTRIPDVLCTLSLAFSHIAGQLVIH